MATVRAPSPLRITFSARAVVARGFAFVPREGSFADADIARDEILHLPAPPEPLVLRVVARGGRKSERASVAGDWLYDRAPGSPRRIPRPHEVWTYERESTAWSRTKTWLAAWETCANACWLLHAAACVKVDPRLVVRAACACARTVLDRFPGGEIRPRRAIEAAEAWARGEATTEEVVQASEGAYEAYQTYRATSDNAAANAAYTAYLLGVAFAGVPSRPEFAFSGVCSFAASTPQADYSVQRVRALATMADLVRREIPTLVVLQAACVG